MTRDHPIRRWLASLCSADTMSRVIDPTLADMRWEDGRVTLRGFAVLIRALAVYTVMSLPARLVAACLDDNYALLRATALMAVGAIVAAGALISSPLADNSTQPPTR